MADAVSSSHGTTFLIVAVVLLVTVGVVGFLPVLDCPLDPYIEYGSVPCPRCSARGRVTLFNRWREGGRPLLLWEGKKLDWIEGHGFQQTTFRLALDHANVFGGLPFTNDKRIAAAKALLATGYYESVCVVASSRITSNTAGVTITVVERPTAGN